MKKSMAIRLGGFAAALCASGALIGTAVSGTGAYFTDVHNGSINASTGDVKVNTSDLSLNFNNLLPGSYQTQTINYQAVGTGAEDIWLVVPSSGADALGTYNSPNALGRYGHFEIDTNTGNFVSNNLSGGQDQAPCNVDANGHGGSDAEATYPNQGDPKPTNPITLPYCAVPQAILLDSNLTYGQTGSAQITFGYTKVLRSGSDAPSANVANFKIVATQHGVSPEDTANPAGSGS